MEPRQGDQIPAPDIDFEQARTTLYAAVIADILDDMGHRDQVMTADVRPVMHQQVLVGRARTMLAVPEFEEPGEPFTTQIEATDALAPGDLVVAHCSGITHAAFWGELFSTAARARGAVGCVMDGYSRDTRKVLDLGFPLFATGIRPINSKGRLTVTAYDRPVRCGGVLVRSGDIVFAEADGIVVIPHEIAPDAIDRALAVATKESQMREDLIHGGLTLREAWLKHRVL